MNRNFLSVILCLLAAMPQQVCTCAVAADSRSDRACAVECLHEQSACEEHHCCSESHDVRTSMADVNPSLDSDPGHQHRQHDGDCRSVLGAPPTVISQSIDLTSAVALSGDLRLLEVTSLLLFEPVHYGTLDPPHLPRYLALNVLRI